MGKRRSREVEMKRLNPIVEAHLHLREVRMAAGDGEDGSAARWPSHFDLPTSS